MEQGAKEHGMGWLPDYPDIRDYTPEHDEVSPRLRKLGETDSVKSILTRTGILGAGKSKLPATVDLRPWCSPIEDQEAIGSCTAHAAVGALEYFERRAFGRHVDASRLFLYKVTRNLLKTRGDTGAFLRTTMGALVLFGVPPEEYWPYVPSSLDKEPPAFCYAFAQSYQAIRYVRLDPPGTSREALLAQVKSFLAKGLPALFGFTVYESIEQASKTGQIPFPGRGERRLGGHAVAAVGYDDSLVIANQNPQGPATKGALLVRNSWGSAWGDGGYGWLPYEYVLQGQAVDWWSLIQNEWIDTEAFRSS
jgi:C1A family cysteine protease